MKTQRIAITAILTLSLAASAMATTPRYSGVIDWNKAEKNYIAAVQSDNHGLRQSAVGFIGEYRLKGAVQDLIKVLNNDKVENNRMAAALSLIRIGEKDGIKAVQEAAIYDGSEKVARFCEQLLSAGSNAQDISLNN